MTNEEKNIGRIARYFDCSLFAQHSGIVGKWKVVVFNSAVYHDYRNDSTAFPEKVLAKLTGDKDSAFVIGFLTGMVKTFQNYYYVFLADGKYQELKDDRLQREGTYAINDKELVLTVKNKMGAENKQTLLFELGNNKLYLKVPSEDKPTSFELERFK